jgi:hypothetical protein
MRGKAAHLSNVHANPQLIDSATAYILRLYSARNSFFSISPGVTEHELTGKTFPLLRSEPADQECPRALLPNVGGLGVQPEEFVEGFPPCRSSA